MITKEQLERQKTPATRLVARHYTIGGTVEAAVHVQVQREQARQYQQGQKTMNNAVEKFRNDMAFKSREGLAKSQFQHAGQKPMSTQPKAKANDHPKTLQSNERVNSFHQTVNTNQKTVER